MKLNDEQLSRVLSEHDYGNLTMKGAFPCLQRFTPCLYQAAFNCADTVELMNQTEPKLTWYDISWFDENYDPNWTTEQFIEQLIKQEIM